MTSSKFNPGKYVAPLTLAVMLDIPTFANAKSNLPYERDLGARVCDVFKERCRDEAERSVDTIIIDNLPREKISTQESGNSYNDSKRLCEKIMPAKHRLPKLEEIRYLIKESIIPDPRPINGQISGATEGYWVTDPCPIKSSDSDNCTFIGDNTYEGSFRLKDGLKLDRLGIKICVPIDWNIKNGVRGMKTQQNKRGFVK